MLKIFQFQEATEASLYGDFKKIIITYVMFVPVSYTVFFFLNEHTYSSYPVLLILNLLTYLPAIG